MTHQPAEFTEALAAVLRDLRAQCPVQPHVREEDDYPGVMLFAPDGSGQGVYAEGDERRPAVLLAEVADQVQGWAVEALWAAGVSAVWPGCPEHPDTHPLTATVEKGAAVWVCPWSGAVACGVGELPSGG
ncbi:hypothetical protein [Streptomyces sp. DSM 40750]|uniref:hypothetical protein n=1 Tax=Streptomyces sp. DSM 40750 TaxID=2801030 RepID=UPI00214C015C|nr:hypothetical protein [Streptomyces sp. DSM 40750]UUU23536.1 hypothetical protein JIX55_26555 [Streptomyces sp. DSM 40750]